MKRYIKYLIMFILIFGYALLLYSCMTSEDDVVTSNLSAGGGYFFYYGGNRIWVNRSFRESSVSGRYRGGGPHAGK